VAGVPVVRVYGNDLGVAVTCGKFLRILGVDRAHRRQGIGSALLDDSQATVAARSRATTSRSVLDPGFS